MKIKLFQMLIISLMLFIFSLNAFAQQTPDLPNPDEVANKYVKQNNYITPIFELKELEEKYLASPALKQTYLVAMILLQNEVGNYDEAYRLLDIISKGSSQPEPYRKMLATEITVSPVANAKMLDALDAIEAVADSRQVIMINEEHLTPIHRAVTLQLLSRLYKKGFRYFAAETVEEKDSELNKRGFPTQQTGFYTADPVYADTIRTALKLGYKVVPYESVDPKCQSPADNPQFCLDKRERGQAQNLYERILKNDPQAKIFVHVGRGHNSKDDDVSKNFNFMGYHFKQLTKIDPFSIDQLRYSEHRDTADEFPLYRFLTKNNLLQTPSVFQMPDGSFYKKNTFGYDMAIFHPRIGYENGRATFLKMNGLRKAEKINLKKLKLKANKNLFAGSDAVLIQAFYSQESADAVPVDQIILYPNKEIPVLMLPAGNFRIRAVDKAGKIFSQYNNGLSHKHT